MKQANETPLPFDRVVVVEESQREEFTVAAFLGLPLPVRVRYVLGGRLEFFHGSTPVDRMTALGRLRAYQTARPGRPASS